MLTDKPQVRVATDTLSVGVNLPHVEDVVIVGEPRDVNDIVQKVGRVGHDWKVVKDAQGILYVSASTMAKAALVVGQTLENASAMPPSLASFLKQHAFQLPWTPSMTTHHTIFRAPAHLAYKVTSPLDR